MGIMNMTLLEILGAAGKHIGSGALKAGKHIGKELFEDALGAGSYSIKFLKNAGKYLAGNKGKWFEHIDRKEGETLFQNIFGIRFKEGHVGEGMIVNGFRRYKPLEFGTIGKDGKRYFDDGKKVGFIPKAFEGAVNGAYKGVVNMPFNLINKVALSPVGRLSAGIAAGGLAVGMYKGAQANSLVNAEGGELFGMINQGYSPLLDNDSAVEHIKMGVNNHGAEGNLVFALHTLRRAL